MRSRGWLRWWLCCALWLAAQGARAAAPALLQADTERLDLVPHSQRWIDPAARADRAEAARRLGAGEFRAMTAAGGAGFTRAAHWYTAALQRAPGAADRWLLDVGEPYLDDVQLWWQAPDGTLQRVQMGDRHLALDRPLRGRQHVVGLVLPVATPGAEPLRLWVRVHTASAMNVSLALWRPDAYFDHEAQAIAGWGVVIGLLLLAATLQLIFGLWLRDRVMITFAAFLAALFCLYAGLSGTALLALARPPAWYNDLLVGGGNLAALALASLLTLQTLDIRRHLPPARWLYLVPAALALLALPLVVTDHYGGVAVAVNLWGLVLGLINMGLSLWVWWCRQRDRERLVYMLASWSLGAGITVRVLLLLGLLPASTPAGLAYPAGAVVYLVLMLLAMGIRLASLRHDKLLAQERVAEERRFAAMVAHEFRNPLAGIDRSANLLQLVPELTPAQTASRLGGIRRQVGRLNTLVDSFLTADGGEQRPLQLAPAPVSVGSWLDALRDELDEDARARLDIAVDPTTLQARFDAGLLSLALHNLIDNALRYTPEDRPVGVRARGAADGALELVVTDSGPGLPPEDLDRLGQPYQRGRTAPGRQGTGLGYYFCRRIAEMHGGTVDAANVAPHGLAVTLRLPAARPG